MEKFGFKIFPANKTLFDFFLFIKSIIFPNLPILIRNEFLSFLKILFFERSIIKYFLFKLFILLRIVFGV